MTAATLVHRPHTLEEALPILGARVLPIAGGTDLMVALNARTLNHHEFLDLWPITELRGIEDRGDTLRIGALTTYSQLIQSPLISRYAPALVSASLTIGAVQIQNRGTIGGNIANGSPAGDSLPVLFASDAEIEIRGLNGVRSIPITRFYLGYRRNVLEPGELITAIHLPKLGEGERSAFLKVGTRRAQAISKVMLGAHWRIKDGVIEAFSLSYGSVAPTVIRARTTEAFLTGKRLTPDLPTQALVSLNQDLTPITDLRSTAEYRRRVAGNLLAKVLREAIDE
jgi:CO/xanthine dehydrogenase FAD-binding subunit